MAATRQVGRQAGRLEGSGSVVAGVRPTLSTPRRSNVALGESLSRHAAGVGTALCRPGWPHLAATWLAGSGPDQTSLGSGEQ